MMIKVRIIHTLSCFLLFSYCIFISSPDVYPHLDFIGILAYQKQNLVLAEWQKWQSAYGKHEALSQTSVPSKINQT
jgi:hypothetical protein